MGFVVTVFLYLTLQNTGKVPGARIDFEFLFFPNSEILFDFNEGSSGVFKDHLMF